jgi:hypothetical protein
MSFQFNDTTNYKGLVQMYEKEIGVPRGTISGDTDRLKEFTADVNEAMDDFWTIALPASGTWQLDDTNQVDGSGSPTLAIIRANIVAGQRGYTVDADGAGNQVLEIERVRILQSATATTYVDLEPVDDPNDVAETFDGTQSGAPTTYDKQNNTIRFDLLPSYNATAGLELYVSREASYFSYADTTKKPGVPGILHKFFYLKPALKYARRNALQNLALIEGEVLKMEGDEERGVIGSIARFFGRRARDERHIMTPRLTPYL